MNMLVGIEQVGEIVNAQHAIQRAEVAGLTRLVRAARFNDDDTGAHIVRVAFLSLELARLMGLPQEQQLPLFYAAALHDVGKVAIPDAILKKPGRLTAEERDVMQSHCWAGARLFAHDESDIAHACRTVALNHHENYDGRGYPNQIQGEEIPLQARIVSVADVFDALTMERCYRPAMSYEHAHSLMCGEMRGKFDPQCLALFSDNLERFKALHGLINRLGAVEDLFSFYG